MATMKVNTATLIRGALYTLRHPDHKPATPKDSLRFEYGKPVVIDDLKVLKLLEETREEVADGDGELYDKPVFRINLNVDAPDDGSAPRRTQLSADRVVKKRPLRR